MSAKKWHLLVLTAAIVVAAMLGLSACGDGGQATAAGTTCNAQRDDGCNDIIVPETFIKEFFTHDGTKNFKFSLTVPVEVMPGVWCILTSADSHSTEANNGSQFCQRYGNDTSPEERAQLDKGLSLAEQQAMLPKS